MKNIKQIQSILAAHKQELRERYKIKEIGIFGSYARGEQKKTSDVDILVEFEKTPDFLTFLNMERHLERILGNKVDTVRKSAIRPELRGTILKEVMKI